MVICNAVHRIPIINFRARCGSGDPGSIPGILSDLTACGSSDGKGVKDVFGRPVARIRVGFAR